MCYSFSTELGTSLVSCELTSLLTIKLSLQYLTESWTAVQGSGMDLLYRVLDGERLLLLITLSSFNLTCPCAWHYLAEMQKRELIYISCMWPLLRGACADLQSADPADSSGFLASSLFAWEVLCRLASSPLLRHPLMRSPPGMLYSGT